MSFRAHLRKRSTGSDPPFSFCAFGARSSGRTPERCQVARKVGGEPDGKIANQSVPDDLRPRPRQAVADRQLDAGRGALFGRNQAIADLALEAFSIVVIRASSQATA
jgi:hypothetical protein